MGFLILYFFSFSSVARPNSVSSHSPSLRPPLRSTSPMGRTSSFTTLSAPSSTSTTIPRSVTGGLYNTSTTNDSLREYPQAVFLCIVLFTFPQEFPGGEGRKRQRREERARKKARRRIVQRECVLPRRKRHGHQDVESTADLPFFTVQREGPAVVDRERENKDPVRV